MHAITIQFATDSSYAPKRALLQKWAKAALRNENQPTELSIRVVDIDEMTQLNSTYRHKKGPTNVLSFPVELPEGIPLEAHPLGDIVVCADVVNREAEEQHKSANAHWAHMIVHGVYHLLGHDHENDDEANVMEALEIETLQTLGFENPYESGEE